MLFLSNNKPSTTIAISTSIGVVSCFCVISTIRDVIKLWKLGAATGFPIHWHCLLIPFLHDVFFMIDPKYQVKVHKRLGNHFVTLLGDSPCVIIGTAGMAQQIQNPPDAYRSFKSHPRTPIALALLTREGIVLKDGEEHKRDRRLLTSTVGISAMAKWYPQFSKRFYQGIAINVVQCCCSQSGEVYVDLVPEVETAIFDLMFDVILGNPNHRQDLREEFRVRVGPFAKGIFALSTWSKLFRSAIQARNEMVSLLMEEMKWRKSTGIIEDTHRVVDLVQSHLHATPQDFENPKLEVVAGRLVNPLFASLDTTKGTTMHLFMCMVKHPEYVTRVYEEVYAKFGEKGVFHENANFETLANLPQLEAFVQEVLRTSELISTITRTSKIDIEFTNEAGEIKYVPANSTVMSSAFHIRFNNPENIEPLKFDPDRYLPPRNEHKTDPFYRTSFTTWGFGFRICPGQSLATSELRLFLAIACYYEWEEQKPQTVEYQFLPFKMPLHYYVRAKPRNGGKM
jgi:cytochrome P450